MGEDSKSLLRAIKKTDSNSQSDNHFQSTNRLHRKNLAGVEGFQPPYGGIKTRCLTTWRHPNLEKNRRPASTGPQSLKQGRVIQSASQKAFKLWRHLAQNFLCKILILTGQKNTGPRASQARRTEDR